MGRDRRTDGRSNFYGDLDLGRQRLKLARVNIFATGYQHLWRKFDPSTATHVTPASATRMFIRRDYDISGPL